MARGLLVSYAGPPSMISSLFPDNGLASLAAVLQAAGHEIRILDFNTVGTLRRLEARQQTAALARLLPSLSVEPDPSALDRLLELADWLDQALLRLAERLAGEILDAVDRQGSQFVGFKLWSGDGFLASVRIAERIRRERPAIKLYGGGPAVLYCEDAIFGHTRVFDALVDGEGEEAILGLAAHAEGREELLAVPNLLLHDRGRTVRTPRSRVADLDLLPPPEYSVAVYPSLDGDEQLKYFVLDESRGCPMGCAFCIHQDASGARWRTKSPQRIVQEIVDLSALHGARLFRFGGSYTPARFFRGLAASLAERGVQIQFSAFAHPEGLPEDLEALAAAGCRALFLGIESFVTADLERLGKRLRPERAVAAVRSCLAAGIVPGVALIAPAPGQTEAARSRNREVLRDLAREGPVLTMVSFAGLAPRTRWWAERARFGFDLRVEEDEYRRFLAGYRIRHIVPAAFWQPMPYTIDGEAFDSYAGTSSRFQLELASDGLVVNVPDEVVLLADLLGMSLVEFRERHRALFFSLDAAELGRLVQQANRRIAAR